MFAAFFMSIATRPDWTKDWMVYRGYLDTYSTWVSRSNNTFGMFFTKQSYVKYQLKTLVPNIQSIVRHQLDNPNNAAGKGAASHDNANRGARGSSSAMRGCGLGNQYNGMCGPSMNQAQVRPSGPLKCFLCSEPHFHKVKQNVLFSKMAAGLIRHLVAELYASRSTPAPMFASVPTATTTTLVLSVGASSMGPLNVPSEDIFPIMTKLIPSAWESAPVEINMIAADLHR
jgi:hypothetical protein